MSEALLTGALIGLSTFFIRQVYWLQYRPNHARYRWAFVLLHAASVAVIIVSYGWVCWRHYATVEPVLARLAVGGVLFVVGALVFWWSVFIHKTSLVPKPGEGVTSRGPYRLIRHPIYAGGLLGALGWLVMVPAPAVALDWVVLGASLVLLIQSEEREVAARLPDYAAYRQGTARLVPFVW